MIRLDARGRVPAQQSGISLLITLIALMLLSLAGAAMMRASDFGGIVIGNIAFRQASVHASDVGVEHARNWILTQSTAMVASGGTVTTLHNNVAGRYSATWGDFDPKTFAWTDVAQAYRMTSGELPAGMAGYTVYWVVHRMCQNAGVPSTAATNCIKVSSSTTEGESKKAALYGDYTKSGSSEAPYYRITSRVDGPRSTTTYVQAVAF